MLDRLNLERVEIILQFDKRTLATPRFARIMDSPNGPGSIGIHARFEQGFHLVTTDLKLMTMYKLNPRLSCTRSTELRAQKVVRTAPLNTPASRKPFEKQTFVYSGEQQTRMIFPNFPKPQAVSALWSSDGTYLQKALFSSQNSMIFTFEEQISNSSSNWL